MHFSSPSGQRLSWCRPWKRGAVGCFSNGYCSVTTLRNIVRKVTPKPATGSQNCSLRVGMSGLLVQGGLGGGPDGPARALEGLAGHRRHGVAAGKGVERVVGRLAVVTRR